MIDIGLGTFLARTTTFLRSGRDLVPVDRENRKGENGNSTSDEM